MASQKVSFLTSSLGQAAGAGDLPAAARLCELEALESALPSPQRGRGACHQSAAGGPLLVTLLAWRAQGGGGGRGSARGAAGGGGLAKWLLARGSPARGGLSKPRARGPRREPAHFSAASAEAALRGCRRARAAAAPCRQLAREAARRPSHPGKRRPSPRAQAQPAAGERAARLKPSAQVPALQRELSAPAANANVSAEGADNDNGNEASEFMMNTIYVMLLMWFAFA